MESAVRDLEISERYQLLVGCIVPRPIALVSTVSPQGSVNLAPFSFFNGVGSNPMTLVFCPGNQADGSEKDTLSNCRPVSEGGTGEFVVNASVESYARCVAAAAESLPPGESEFDLTGLTPSPSRVVAPPRVAESPFAFECRTLRVIRLNPGIAGGANLVLGEVAHVFVSDELIDDRLEVDARRLAAIGRMGGTTYSATRDTFELPRGRAALAEDSD